MYSFLLRLFDTLKERGINPTIDEKKDTILSLLKIDISNRDRFVYAIMCNIAHNLSDRLKILQIIDEIFASDVLNEIDINEIANRLSNDSKAEKKILELLTKNETLAAIFLKNIGKKVLIEESDFLNRLYDALIWEEKRGEFFEFINKLNIPNEYLNLISRDSLGSSIKSNQLKSLRPKQIDINSLDFREITDEEIHILKQSIKDAATKLIRKINYSHKYGNSRILNIHKTVRKNIAYESIPFKLVYKNKRMKKRDIIILCDFSQSVRNTAIIMITFLNELSLIFKRVKSFAFVNDITDITHIVSKKDLNEIIHSLLSGGIGNIFGNSNYSLSFYRFYSKYKRLLNRNTILIIIGDGRNNFNEPNLSDLTKIRNKVDKLYWFIPEPRELWGKGDSQIPIYLTVSDRAFTTTNLAQLSTAILKIAG